MTQPSEPAVPSARAHRDFYGSYEITQTDAEQPQLPTTSSKTPTTSTDLIKYLHDETIGLNDGLRGPWGPRRITYCDYTASARSLNFIEEYLYKEVLPVYGNTHTNTTYTGLQSTLYRREARDIVRRSVGGGNDDVVLFTGSGSTSAMHLLVHALDLTTHSSSDDTQPPAIVFTSLYEHHSNILPFREAGCKVITIAQNTAQNGIDTHDLQQQITTSMQQHPNVFHMASFTAASNVTGYMLDTNHITALCKSAGCQFVMWDYATAAPYVEIEMNPLPQLAQSGTAQQHTRIHCEKDAIIMSGHKFIGGPQTPGILVVKKRWLRNRKPLCTGGGSVFYVNSTTHRYLENFEELNETSGTPDIVSSVRAGLVFQLKHAVGAAAIMQREHELTSRALAVLKSHPNIILLGHSPDTKDTQPSSPSSSPQLPIFSFLIRFAPTNTLLHSNYISTLLNDVFGIQTRAGCVCSGVYAHHLLGIDAETSTAFEQCLLEKQELLRPAFVRFNLHYTLNDAEVDYVLHAIQWVATHAHQMLPSYRFDVETGEWKHHTRATKFVGRRWLGAVSYKSGKMTYTNSHVAVPSGNDVLQQYKSAAEQVLNDTLQAYRTMQMPQQDTFLTANSQRLRWFLLPSEALQYVQHGSAPQQPLHKHTIMPLGYEHLFTAATERTEVAQRKAPTQLPAARPDVDDVQPDEHKDMSHEADSNAADATTTTYFDSHKRKIDNDAQQATQQPSKRLAGSKGTDKAKPSVDPLCQNCYHSHTVSTNQQKSISTQCLSCQCVSYTPLTTSPSLADVQQSKRKLAEKVGSKIQKLVGKAIADYSMIKENDKILVGVSGGKDSLTLIHILKRLQRKSPVKFEIGAVTVDPQTPEYNPRPLIDYFQQLNIPYFYESHPILETAKTAMDPKRVSICSFCSRMKRGILYGALRREGYNVLALGQHADDMCESLLMSLFHNGLLRTMKANYHVEAGDLRIIRPLLYVRERMTRDYSINADLPVIPESCPACFSEPKERQRVKLLLASQESVHPTLINSMQKAMTPLIAMENKAFMQQRLDEQQKQKLAGALSKLRQLEAESTADTAALTCGINGRESCDVVEDEDEMTVDASDIAAQIFRYTAAADAKAGSK